MKKLITYRTLNVGVQRVTSLLNKSPIWLFSRLASFSCPFILKCRVSNLLLFECWSFKKYSVLPPPRQNRKAWIRPRFQKGTRFNPFCQALRCWAWSWPRPYRKTGENLHAKASPCTSRLLRTPDRPSSSEIIRSIGPNCSVPAHSWLVRVNWNELRHDSPVSWLRRRNPAKNWVSKVGV